MASQLRSNAGRRLGPGGNPRWQVARHWAAYTRYLGAVKDGLTQVRLPGKGEVRLDETFVPLRLHEWAEDEPPEGLSAERPSTVSIEEALQRHEHVLLIGSKGSGKSALLRQHAIRTAAAARALGPRGLLAEGGPPELPIYVPLSRLPERADLLSGGAAVMEQGGFEDAERFLEAHLLAGRAVLIFDDLDTFAHDARRDMASRIARFVGRYPGNAVIVATRDVADATWLPDFAIYEITGIDTSRVDTLAARWGYASVASTSGFLQVIERCPLVRSVVGRPGWLAAGLSDAGVDRIRALDVLDNFVRFVDEGSQDDPVWPGVAITLHEAHDTVGDRSLVPEGHRRSGLLTWQAEDRFSFVHPAVQAWFAAKALDLTDPQIVETLVGRNPDPWWSAVSILAAGLAAPESAAGLAERLLDEGYDRTAALALTEMSVAPTALLSRTLVSLLGDMGEGDEKADRSAAISIAAMLETEPVRRTGISAPVLVALERGPVAARVAAAEALGRLRDPGAIAPLLTALADPESEVRDAVSDALAAFGDRTLQPLVRQLTVPNDTIRRAATRALSQQGSRAVPALISQLESSSATVRSEAADALAATGAPAVAALIDTLTEEQRGHGVDIEQLMAKHEAAAKALTKIGAPSVGALVGVYAAGDPAHRQQVVEILQAMGPEAVEALAATLDDPRHPNSTDAAGLLGELCEQGRQAATHLVGALGDERFEVRWEARRSLRRLEGVAQPALLAALEGDEPVRWEAAQILISMPESPADALLPVLEERLSSEAFSERRQAVQALGELSTPQAFPLLERALRDNDAVVRRAAIAQLGAEDDPRAVPALMDRWKPEENADARLAILDALASLGDERAVPTLIDALADEDAQVCATSADLLAGFGEPTVIPLIEALNSRPAELDLEGALHVLESTGISARAGGRSPANLARTYHRMLVEPLDVDELVYLATTIEWWPPALELHRTFTTVKQFMEYGSLGGVGGAEAALEWIDDVDPWLRPAAQRALRQVRLVSQAVQYYNRSGTRSAKEKGLLTATARVNELHAMIGELGEPHTRVFHELAEHWSDLINQAIRELQGRAELELELRTEHVRIRDVEAATAVLVFELSNRGEGLASNVQLSLSDTEDEQLVLQSAPTQYLPPLGHGDKLSTEFTVLRKGAGVVPLTIALRFDDPQREGQSRTYQREVRFFVEEAEYREIGKSPYIAGPPVKSREMFYGRQPTFDWVQENLSGTYQDNVLVLYGERRTGKTSVLYQLQHHLPETYAFVLIDLQSIAYALSSTGDLLYAMARKSISGLKRKGFDLERPDRDAYAEHPLELFEQLGEDMGTQAMAKGKRAVLIVDEFDLLIEAVENGQVTPYVFDCIRGLMQHQDGVSFIFTGAGKVSEMLKNPQSILFNTALRRKVSFLEREEAERLIREPVADVLWYDDLAVEKILRVTAGHAYFIQYICHEIVNIARSEQKNFVTLRDIDRALQTTVQETTGIIRHAYMSLGLYERAILAAMSRITDDGRPYVSLDDILETLRHDDIALVKRDAFEMVRTLLERDFILERDSDSSARQYGFTMDLVRVWLEQNDEYNRLLEELRHE